MLESSPASYQLSEEEVQTTQLSIAAYLIEHPDGVLLFDSLGIADAERIPDGTGKQQTIVRPDGQERHVTLARSLTAQLADIGYTPDDITHVAFSHLHWDHTANANLFASAKWLVRPEERALRIVRTRALCQRQRPLYRVEAGPRTADRAHAPGGAGLPSSSLGT